MGLPDGEEIMPLAFFVLTQYRRVTDRWTDGQTDGQTDGHVAITIKKLLNLQFDDGLLSPAAHISPLLTTTRDRNCDI